MIAELIFQTVAEVTMQVAGYATGRIVVPLFTLGRVKVEPMTPSARSVLKGRRVARAPDGTYVVDGDVGCLAGLVFWFAVAGVCFLVHRLSA